MLGKYYFIVSRMNGFVMEVEGADDDRRTKVLMMPKQDEAVDHQLWFDDHDTQTIRTKLNEDRCLRLRDGELVIDKYDEDEEDRLWVYRRGRGVIQNGDDRDFVLDIHESCEDEGAMICGHEEHGGDNQQWDCERIPWNHFFKIKNRDSGLVMEVKRGDEDEGAKIWMMDEDDDDDDRQLWWEDEFSVIRSKLTGFALQADADDEGDCVKCYTFDDGNEEQHWVRNRLGHIINRYQRERAIGCDDGDDGRRTNVVVADRTGDDSQVFDFEFKAME